MNISVYTDADYVAASDNRSSMSGIAVLGDTAIGSKSSTQKCVTTATCEAEYVAQGGTLLEDCLGIPYLIGTRVDIFVDNGVAKVITDNPSSVPRSKHIDGKKRHFFRGLIRAGELRVLHVGTEERHADVLTKPLWRETLIFHHGGSVNLS